MTLEFSFCPSVLLSNEKRIFERRIDDRCIMSNKDWRNEETNANHCSLILSLFLSVSLHWYIREVNRSYFFGVFISLNLVQFIRTNLLQNVVRSIFSKNDNDCWYLCNAWRCFGCCGYGNKLLDCTKYSISRYAHANIQWNNDGQ